MRPWNLYNASMEIVSRCNSFFSKLFIYRVMRFNGLTIDANPRYKFPAPYNIHMIVDKGGNRLEVYLNFYGMYSLSNCDDGDLERIAYSLGHDVASRFGVTKNKTGFIFFFDENLTYPEYNNHYEFVVNGERKSIDSDYPLLNHMQTEFDLEFQLFNEEQIKPGISEITKNGKPLFDVVQYMNKPSWGIIRFEKTETNYTVSMQDCNFFSKSKYTIKIFSYMGQYSALEIVPTLPTKEGMNPFVEIYLSGDDENYLVFVERIRNYGMTHDDLQASFAVFCDKIGVDKNVDWSSKLFY